MESREKNYENIPTMEDREELLSNTEVEDSLMGDEEKGQWHRNNHLSSHEARRKRDTRNSHRWIMSTILQVLIVALLALILYRQQESKQPVSETPQVGSSFTGKGPTSE